MSSPDALCSARAALPALTRPSEREVLQSLIPSARLSAEERAQVFTHGVALLEAVRGYEKAGWVERFLQEYRLNTDEGVALLSLAEAYLRVPDSETATALIRDKLLSADWEAHSGKAGSLLVDSATFGLILTQSLVSQEESANVLKKLISRTSEPFVRTAIAAAMRFMGQQFVMGRTINEALSRAKDKENRAYLYSFDMLGEAARTAADAQRYFKAYEEAIQAVGMDADDSASILHRNTVSVKLSALHPRFDVPHADRSVPALIERTRALAILARSAGVGLTIDAEETERLELSLDIIEAVARDPALKGWDGLGMAVQAYQKRARKVIAWADALAGETSRKMTVRLVKGAYWDAEIKRAQERGLADYPVFTRKAATDVSYLACAKDMLACQHLYPAFASHNALTVATLRQWLGDRRDFEFQRLHGMGQGLYEALMEKDGVRCRVYAPVGGHQDLLAYLVRRLLENGANSSFVHQLADKSVPPEVLLADPIETVERAGLAPHPAIPLPQALYGQERQNAKGLDLADAGVLETLANTYEAVWAQPHSAAPLIGGKALSGPSQPVLDPADTRRVVGSVIAATPEQVAQALERASKAQAAWSRRDVEERAVILERLADRLEADTGPLMGLLAREAGKTMADALAEVREAVDFCRYYAVEARRHMTEVRLPGPTGEDNRLRLSGRGVFACISPWNFPLAIFLGQVAAALVTGNAVVAKPAPQTPLIAMRTAQHILEAGVPGDVFHLIPGGPDVGHALVGDPRVTGVAFTGSTATARRIARTLLDDDHRPLVPLIAETGGINAMIVDSTALPEQVVADVITSAFQSAGQRCSALRLLCVQEDVAPRILEMLEGAAQELRLGDPASIRTDIGPVIDQAAWDRLRGYVAAHQDQVLFSLPLTADHANGWFVAPHALKVSRIEDVREEVFGPILHVTTWAAGELEDVVHRINASGYGLTMGLHSRLKSAADQVSAQAEVGNLYINRSMIGAVVGVQPFGGEGLSGTGPKAGGPHYLPRFCIERTISMDTTSAGGNASLLSLEDE